MVEVGVAVDVRRTPLPVAVDGVLVAGVARAPLGEDDVRFIILSVGGLFYLCASKMCVVPLGELLFYVLVLFRLGFVDEETQTEDRTQKEQSSLGAIATRWSDKLVS